MGAAGGCRARSRAPCCSRSTWRRAWSRAVDPLLVQAGARVVREVRQARREDRRTTSRATATAFYGGGQSSTCRPRTSCRDPARAGPRVRAGLDRRPRGAGRRLQAAARLLRARRVVVAVPAALEPPGRAGRPTEPAEEGRLDRRPPRRPSSAEAAVEVAHAAGGRRSTTASSWWARTSPRRCAAPEDPAGPVLPHQVVAARGYKIFVHFDGPAAPRVIGDHDPLNKAFPPPTGCRASTSAITSRPTCRS